MRILIKNDCKFALNGINVKAFKAGEEAELDEKNALRMIELKLACDPTEEVAKEAPKEEEVKEEAPAEEEAKEEAPNPAKKGKGKHKK